MTKEEREFIVSVNIDKAKNKTVVPIFIISISILSYIYPLMLGVFDFGIIFEVASLVFLIIARNYMNKCDEIRSKRYVICAIISVGWILIYDIIVLLSSFETILGLDDLWYVFLIGFVLLFTYITRLFSINKDLAKADNPVKYKESADWFYETYEGKEHEDNK